MNKEDIYQAKQVWLERVMASSLTPAQKVFAFSIYKRAYGLKVTSYPGPANIVEDTNLTPGKFSEHRKALFASGALSGVKSRQAGGKQDNYTYTMNLDWNGTITPTDSTVTPTDTPVTPEGERSYPTGGSNTTSNTSMNTSSKTEEAVADAPASTLNQDEDKEEVLTEKTDVIDTSSLSAQRLSLALDKKRAENEWVAQQLAELEKPPTQEELDRATLDKDQLRRYWNLKNKERKSHEDAMTEARKELVW